MAVIDETIISNFAKPQQEEVIDNALTFANSLILTALEDIAKTNPYVAGGYEIVPFGAFYEGAVLPSSTLEIFLVLQSPQIAINTSKLFKSKWQVFKSRLSYAWKNRKKKKKNRKKKKRQGSEEAPKVLYQNHKNDYNLVFFAEDLMNTLAKYVTTEDIVRLRGGKLLIEGKNVPFKIQIQPVIQKDTAKFWAHNSNHSKLIEIDIKTYTENITKLVQNLGESYLEQVRIFKGIYEYLTGQSAQGLFLQSLVANLPNCAFESGNAYENFVFSVNYLSNCYPSTFFSVANPDKKIFEDPLCETTLIEINNFFRKLIVKVK